MPRRSTNHLLRKRTNHTLRTATDHMLRIATNHIQWKQTLDTCNSWLSQSRDIWLMSTSPSPSFLWAGVDFTSNYRLGSQVFYQEVGVGHKQDKRNTITAASRQSLHAMWQLAHTPDLPVSFSSESGVYIIWTTWLKLQKVTEDMDAMTAFCHIASRENTCFWWVLHRPGLTKTRTIGTGEVVRVEDREPEMELVT